MRLINTKWFFVLVLIIYLGVYAVGNWDAGLEKVSTDLVSYQMTMVQEKEASWSYVPPAYNREALYVIYPLVYWLNPGLDHGMGGHHAMVLLLIIATYVVSGLVLYKITKHWGWATLGALLLLIPHNVGFTTTGISHVGDLRGNIFAFPFYLLLGYYWLIEGIRQPVVNICLAIAAGLLMYIYPIASLVTVGVFAITALILYRRKYLKSLCWFTLVYALVISPFMTTYVTNPNAAMVAERGAVSTEQIAEQSAILEYRFGANGFLSSVDLARIKRTLWDMTPLLLIFVVGVFVLSKLRNEMTEYEWRAHQVSMGSAVVLLLGVVGVDVFNMWLISHGQLPFFLEHVRALRLLGFILTAEAIVVLSVCWRLHRHRFVVGAIALLLVVLPLHFSAPFVRGAVRAVVPEGVRETYNLAPVVPDEAREDFDAMHEAALWARSNISSDARIFLLSDSGQYNFLFKFFSRHDTNLTAKEGSLWTTSGPDNARVWYEERRAYDRALATGDWEVVKEFAQSLNMTHVFVSKQVWGGQIGGERLVYENEDYVVVGL